MINVNEYGKALFALAEEESMLDAMHEELEAVAGLLRDNPDYVTLLCTPAVASREKPGLIDEALSSCHPYVRDTLKLLATERAVWQFPDIAKAYGAYLDESRGILRATAICAVPMSDAQKKRLCDKLSAMTGKQIILTSVCDTSVIGGVELICDGTRFDGSIKSRLETLRRELVGAHI